MTGDDVVDLVAAAADGVEVVARGDVPEDLTRDEALGVEAVVPACVAYPRSTHDVAAILATCSGAGIPVTARGSGTGLSGAAVPHPDGVLLSFERMAQIVEIDTENLVAVVQPGVSLDQLDAALEPLGLVYPVFPGEYSASLGGKVATNAGGMRAVKYGVTRHQVLGLEAVLASGEVITTGGRYVKGSTGYDLTQLIIGSEGTLAIVTEAILRLYPRLEHRGTVLAPFTTLDEVTAAVPKIVASGVGPMILEYIDLMTMSAMVDTFGIELGVPDDVKQTALAYLVVQLEQSTEERLDQDVAAVATQLAELGAIDVYVLPSNAATQLIEAREGVLARQGGQRRRHRRRRRAPRLDPGVPVRRERTGGRARGLGGRLRPRRRRQCPPLGVPTRRGEAHGADDAAVRLRDGARRCDLGRARRRSHEEAVLRRPHGPVRVGAHAPDQARLRSPRHPQPGGDLRPETGAQL